MANSILDSHYASPGTILQSHGWPAANTQGNSVLASHTIPYPDPGGGGGGSTLTHGSSFAITSASFGLTGNQFGTKPAQTPYFHWNGDNTTPTFSDSDGVNPGFRVSGAGDIPVVATPNASRLTHYWAAMRGLANAAPYDAMVEVDVNHTASWGTEIYTSFYHRLSPTWTSGTNTGDPDKQIKVWAWDHNGGYYTPPNAFVGIADIDENDGDILNGDGEYRWLIPEGMDTTTSTYGIYATNPTKGWIRLESVMRISPTDGWGHVFETTTVGNRGRNRALPRSDASNGPDWAIPTSPPAQTSIMCGGYIRDWGVNNYWYFTDIFIDIGSTRIVLGNANTLAACTMLEPQPYTAWGEAAITLKGNCGGLTAGSTGYLYALTGANTQLGSPLAVTIAG